MAVMEGVEGIPGLFVASNQPDVFRLGTVIKFHTLELKRLEITKGMWCPAAEENFSIQ